MESEFAERQYEFLVNHHLLTRYGASVVGGMPEIPSQPKEAKLGYDFHGQVLFLQLKVSILSNVRRAPFSDSLAVP